MQGYRARWIARLLIRELCILAPFTIIVGALAAFAQIADKMIDGETHGFDETILLAFRTHDPADPVGPAWLENAMQDLTSMGGHTVLTLITMFAIGYLLIRRKQMAAVVVALSSLGGMLLNHILKIGFDRPRPDLVSHLAEVHTLSFPSGHAMLSAIIYLTLGALLSRSQQSPVLKLYILAVAILVTMVVGISRIYLGVHWPTDVLGGWCIGAAWAICCLQLHRYLEKNLYHQK